MERAGLKEVSNGEWRETFPVSRRSFNKLGAKLDRTLRPQEETVHALVPLEMREVL